MFYESLAPKIYQFQQIKYCSDTIENVNFRVFLISLETKMLPKSSKRTKMRNLKVQTWFLYY